MPKAARSRAYKYPGVVDVNFETEGITCVQHATLLKVALIYDCALGQAVFRIIGAILRIQRNASAKVISSQ